MPNYNSFDYWSNGSPQVGGKTKISGFNYSSDGQVFTTFFSESYPFQIVLPTGDVANTGWANEPLYTGVNEFLPDDANYIYSSKQPSNDVCLLKLGNIASPTGLPCILKYRYRRYPGSGDSAINFNIELLEGGTPISSGSYLIEDGVFESLWQTGSFSLSQNQFDSISDWNNLFIRLTAGV